MGSFSFWMIFWPSDIWRSARSMPLKWWSGGVGEDPHMGRSGVAAGQAAAEFEDAAVVGMRRGEAEECGDDGEAVGGGLGEGVDGVGGGVVGGFEGSGSLLRGEVRRRGGWGEGGHGGLAG